MKWQICRQLKGKQRRTTRSWLPKSRSSPPQITHTHTMDEETVQFPTTSILFPQGDALNIFLDGDWRDRPASEWAIASSGTLQAKIEWYRTNYAHRRPSFLSKADEIPFHALVKFANAAYGYSGWSTGILETRVVKEEQSDDGERFTLAVESKVRVTLKDGTYHESEGLGTAINLPQKSMAYRKAKKESITAATKSCIQGFGDLVLDHEERLRKGYYSSGLFDFQTNR